MVILARLELDQGVKRHLIADAVHRAPPALLLDLPADVDVDAERDEECGQGPPVVDGEHDGEADHEAAARGAHVPRAPAPLVDARGPPGGGLEPGQREAGDVHEGVCNQKAHGQQWRHKVQLADQDQDGSNKVGRPQCTLGLAVRQRRQLVQEPDDLVLGNGLEQPRRDDAALQRLAQGGDDDAHDGRLGEGVPDDLLHHPDQKHHDYRHCHRNQHRHRHNNQQHHAHPHGHEHHRNQHQHHHKHDFDHHFVVSDDHGNLNYQFHCDHDDHNDFNGYSHSKLNNNYHHQ
mmetsp:Transcript_20401/g.57405  ORF Transcript_20401/g.57405 Transcript_20401/m.57405 type:complete len:289 (-) Transcript_20401:73-939(-)